MGVGTPPLPLTFPGPLPILNVDDGADKVVLLVSLLPEHLHCLMGLELGTGRRRQTDNDDDDERGEDNHQKKQKQGKKHQIHPTNPLILLHTNTRHPQQ